MNQLHRLTLVILLLLANGQTSPLNPDTMSVTTAAMQINSEGSKTTPFLQNFRNVIADAHAYLLRADLYAKRFMSVEISDPMPIFLDELTVEEGKLSTILRDIEISAEQEGADNELSAEMIEKTKEIISMLKRSLLDLHKALTAGWKRRNNVGVIISLAPSLLTIDGKLNTNLKNALIKIKRISKCAYDQGDINLAKEVATIGKHLKQCLDEAKKRSTSLFVARAFLNKRLGH